MLVASKNFSKIKICCQVFSNWIQFYLVFYASFAVAFFIMVMYKSNESSIPIYSGKTSETKGRTESSIYVRNGVAPNRYRLFK